MKPSKHKMTVLSQIFKLISRNLIPKLGNEFGIDKQSRTFSPTIHVLALVFGQLTHALGLNDICDALRNHFGLLSKIRDCVAPSRNCLPYANRNRDAGMAEKLFWEVLEHLNTISQNFQIQGRQYCALPHRFKQMIHVVDSTTIQLIANCLDWTKHRRRKAATKMHLRLDLRSFLPNFILVKNAGTHDSAEAPRVCAGVNAGEIVIFDKAYVDFKHLYELFLRGVFWVTRAKDNMKYEVVGQHSAPKLNILRDVIIHLSGPRTALWYPETLRLVEAVVEVDGKLKQMTFITNNFEWAASSICDLYKAHWAIEVFFKEIKTLQLADFMGYNGNAVRWQIWTALLTYILLRFIAWQNEWKHSFIRLFTVLRRVVWHCLDMASVLKCCGTASGPVRLRGAPEQAFYQASPRYDHCSI